MKTPDKDFLVLYEMPSIGEYVGIGWLQSLIARYTVHKINRKLARWNTRVEREKFCRDNHRPQ